MRRFGLLLVLLPALAAAQESAMSAPGAAEQSVCGFLKEPFTFWLWSRAAGSPNADAAKRLPNAESITYRTRDARELRGYRLSARAPDGRTRGALLVAQGNAMLADQLLSTLDRFAAAGYDVYIFDYRGYGRSEGRPRLKAIVGDYAELHRRFIAPVDGTRLGYGISFGGIVLMNVAGGGAVFDRAAIDGTPARVSPHGCPGGYAPVEHLPGRAGGWLFVGGERDRVVPLADSAEMLDAARARGARVEIGAEFAHPFMDPAYDTHQRRLALIERFLAGR